MRRAGHRLPAVFRRGLTLIEVLVVMAILGVLLAVIGACLHGGIRVWGAANTLGTRDTGTLIAMESLRRDLANNIPLSLRPFAGTPSGMSFSGLFAGDDNAPVPGLVEYAYDPAVGVLYRTFESCPPSGIPPRREEFLTGLESLTLRYCRTPGGSYDAWMDSWSDPSNRPAAVYIELRESGNVFGTTVNLPAEGAGTGGAKKQ